MAELEFLSAIELARAIREKKLSPLDVMKSLFDRIDAVNPRINALITLHRDEAMCSAAKAEAAVMRGEKLGPLHGVPLHVKDNLYVAGSRTTFGSKLHEKNITTEDCPAVERLRRAGMIVVARSNTPEQGWKGVTDNRVFGVTRNPWNTELTPGGSSGGAAAAVAAGLGPIGLGTDGGGSLRIPASFCGVFGFKASFGRIPNWPGSGGAMLRHIGAMTRTVADMAVCVDAMAGPDARDLLSLPGPTPNFAADLEKGIRGKKIAYSPDLGYASVDSEVARICAKAAEKFAETGAKVETVALNWTDPYPPWSVFFFGTFAAALGMKLEDQGDQLDPGLFRVVLEGMKIRGFDFGRALAARHEFWEQVRKTYENFDLVLCPTVAVLPFSVRQDEAPLLNGRKLAPLHWTQFTYPFNLTGQPTASVPAGWTEAGLPVGLQIVGNRFADLEVLQAARAWEQIAPWGDRRPSLKMA